MSLLRSILRTAHCRSTHHYFAVDALPLVQTDAGKRLVRHLLCHHKRYLSGAVDPDIRFRDFQNHVVHVNEGYWGGAPRVAYQWYHRLIRYLRTDRFSDAAHAAGVLSHYFTDPFQPMHTEASAEEAVIHRPVEWSVLCAYDAILRGWSEDEMRIVFHLSDGPEWLGEAILHGARFAHRKRRRILNRYNLESAVTDPANAIDGDLRGAFSELFGLTITGWARVIERVAADAEAVRASRLPRASTVRSAGKAIAASPLGVLSRYFAYREERQAIALLVDEYQRLGELKRQLPVDVDIVHRVVRIHEREQQWRGSSNRSTELPATLPFPAAGPERPTPQAPASPVSIPIRSNGPERRSA